MSRLEVEIRPAWLALSLHTLAGMSGGVRFNLLIKFAALSSLALLVGFSSSKELRASEPRKPSFLSTNLGLSEEQLHEMGVAQQVLQKVQSLGGRMANLVSYENRAERAIPETETQNWELALPLASDDATGRNTGGSSRPDAQEGCFLGAPAKRRCSFDVFQKCSQRILELGQRLRGPDELLGSEGAERIEESLCDPRTSDALIGEVRCPTYPSQISSLLERHRETIVRIQNYQRLLKAEQAIRLDRDQGE